MSVKIWVTLVFVVGATTAFEIIERFPQTDPEAGPENVPTFYVQSGSKVELSCTTSEKFSLCQWANPSGSAPCGIFSPASQKLCHNTGLSKTKVSSSDQKTCKLTIDRVTEPEVGKWTCLLQKHGDNVEASSTMIEVAEAPQVIINGPRTITVYNGKEKEFECEATGTPTPKRMSWSISRGPISGLTVLSSETKGNKIVERVSVVPSSSWDDASFACHAEIEDDQGKIVEGFDERRIEARVVEENDLTDEVQRMSSFEIIERHPAGDRGTIPQMTLSSDKVVTFSCESNYPWHVCLWKSPFSDQSCGIFADDILGKECTAVWTTNNLEWKIRKTSDTTCSITGKTSDLDEGEWNCELQSKPVSSQNNIHKSDQQYFEVQLIKPAQISIDFPKEFELRDGESQRIVLDISGAFPKPEVIWRLNNEDFKPVLIDSEPPTMDSRGLYSLKQEIDFKAKSDDNGRRLFCIIRQVDAEGNIEEQTFEAFLNIKAKPMLVAASSLGPGIIAAIVSVAVLILLIIILLCVSYRTGKLCFKNRRKPETIYLGEGDQMLSKPDESNKGDGTETYAQDAKTAYKDEGEGSPTGSLLSLEGEAPKRDWKDAVKTMGPKFGFLESLQNESVQKTESEVRYSNIQRSQEGPNSVDIFVRGSNDRKSEQTTNGSDITWSVGSKSEFSHIRTVKKQETYTSSVPLKFQTSQEGPNPDDDFIEGNTNGKPIQYDSESEI